MRPKPRTVLIVFLLLFVLSGVLLYVDHEHSRPDRLAATERSEEMISVRDQLLRYENDHGTLPQTLEELTPRYVREDQIAGEGQPLYVYDPGTRTLRQSQAPIIRGLFTREWPAVAMELPPPGPEILAGREARFNAVRDAVLHYHRRHDSLPRSLEELIPKYLDAERLVRDDVTLYTYDPTVRALAEAPDSLILPPSGEGSECLSASLPAAGEPTGLPAFGAGQPGDDAANLFDDGPAIVPVSPKLPAPPKGALVFEAEHFSEMNYGWEVHPDAGASGGAYLHSWEGITNGPAQMEHGAFDFFDVQSKREYTVLRYYFRVPKSGSYRAYGRMWTTDTHCSNSVNAGIDCGGPHAGWMGNRTPFRWRWTPMQPGDVYLKEGDHYLHIFIHEDGIRIDQFILVPERVSYGAVRGGKAYRANLLTGEDTAWRKKKGPAVHLSFDLARQVISPTSPPDCNVVLRRLRPASGKATLHVTLEDAGSNGADWRVARHTVELSKLPEVCLVPLDFEDLNLARLPRREFLLRAELLKDGETIASAHVTLLRPWVWEACGPLRYMRNHSRGPLDAKMELKPDGKLTWKPVEEKSLDHFGVLDFGLHAIGNSLHAPQYQTIYARTRIHVPESKTYLFLIQTDDQMLLWLDGKLIYRYDDDNYMPVTRSASRRKIKLDAGDHELRCRVNQTITRWQAAVRIRTVDDLLSNVVGLPHPQDTPAASHARKSTPENVEDTKEGNNRNRD